MSEIEEVEELTTSEDKVLTPQFMEQVAGELEKMKKEKEKKEEKEKRIADSVPSTWKMSSRSIESVRKAIAMVNTEYGLYATIPMICKGEDCVYAKLFPDIHEGLTEGGERCPVEVAMIVTKYNAYAEELEIGENDAVDQSILRDVIDCDIQIMRAENKMAIEGEFIKEEVIGIAENGKPIIQEVISKAAEYKERIQAKRDRSLGLLNSTRKDKAGNKLNVNVMDPSTYAKQLLSQEGKELTIEGDFSELEIIPDVEPYKNDAS